MNSALLTPDPIERLAGGADRFPSCGRVAQGDCHKAGGRMITKCPRAVSIGRFQELGTLNQTDKGRAHFARSTPRRRRGGRDPGDWRIAVGFELNPPAGRQQVQLFEILGVAREHDFFVTLHAHFEAIYGFVDFTANDGGRW
ncbi:MAG: hypothetical protein WD690_20425 [Vicinamibacterales bacterium]